MFLVATLALGSASTAVRVRNLSTTGALVEARELPHAGSLVVLRRGPLEARGSVAWTDAGRAGLSFDAPIIVSEWLPAKELARQAQVDRIAFGIKQARPAAVLAAVSDPALMSLDAVIADVVRLRAELGRLGDVLAQDEAVVASYPGIQLFDSAVQRLAKIADALRAQS